MWVCCLIVNQEASPLDRGCEAVEQPARCERLASLWKHKKWNTLFAKRFHNESKWWVINFVSGLHWRMFHLRSGLLKLTNMHPFFFTLIPSSSRLVSSLKMDGFRFFFWSCWVWFSCVWKWFLVCNAFQNFFGLLEFFWSFITFHISFFFATFGIDLATPNGKKSFGLYSDLTSLSLGCLKASLLSLLVLVSLRFLRTLSFFWSVFGSGVWLHLRVLGFGLDSSLVICWRLAQNLTALEFFGFNSRLHHIPGTFFGPASRDRFGLVWFGCCILAWGWFMACLALDKHMIVNMYVWCEPTLNIIGGMQRPNCGSGVRTVAASLRDRVETGEVYSCEGVKQVRHSRSHRFLNRYMRTVFVGQQKGVRRRLDISSSATRRDCRTRGRKDVKSVRDFALMRVVKTTYDICGHNEEFACYELVQRRI